MTPEQGPRRFTDLRARNNRNGMCARCGAPRVAHLALVLRDTHPEGKGLGKQHSSWTRVLCEPCAVQLFVEAERVLERGVTDAVRR